MMLPLVRFVPEGSLSEELATFLRDCRARGTGHVDLALLLGREQMPLTPAAEAEARQVPLVMLRAGSSDQEVVAALRAMLRDVARNGSSSAGLSVLESAISLVATNSVPRPGPSPLIGGERLIGETPAMQELKSYIEKAASTDSNVLITGETGTGKELVAELIQKNGARRSKPFLCINCAAIPDSLLESELFGYERGAFTGAQASCAGKLEGAQGGTIFLDEIGEMSPYAQAKILRAIESREIQRLGSKRTTRLDLRVIAATNQDIDSANGSRLRRDLYFRLNVARIQLPPLRERKGDIPLLVGHYLGQLNRQFGRKVEGFTPQALQGLLQHDWPGNVRELKNVLEAVFVNLPAAQVSHADLPARLGRQLADIAAQPPNEHEQLLSALWATDWNKSKAARQLHWSRMTLYRKMAKYGLEQKPAAGTQS